MDIKLQQQLKEAGAQFGPGHYYSNERMLKKYPNWESQPYTKELCTLLKKLKGVSGIYSFWDGPDLLYIGCSQNLGQRISSSLYDRFHFHAGDISPNSTKPLIDVKVIVTSTIADALILEAYFIGMLQPSMNVGGCGDKKPTLTVSPIPDWSERVRCNWKRD